MNYIVLLASYGRLSTEKIAEKMVEPCNLLAKTRKDEWLVNTKGEEGRVWGKISRQAVIEILKDDSYNIINWGNHIFGNSDQYFDLNLPSCVALASNKTATREALRDNGIAIPETWFLGELPKIKPGEKFIARPSHHTKGRDFHVISSINELSTEGDISDWYFSRIFEKTHEHRVYVCHGKVLMVHEKPLIPGEIRANYAINAEAWRILKWSEHIEKENVESIRAVEALGLDYGAVDIMYNEKTGEVAIAEVNTSPQVTSEYTSKKFAAYFDWAIRHDFPDYFGLEGKSIFYNALLRE